MRAAYNVLDFAPMSSQMISGCVQNVSYPSNPALTCQGGTIPEKDDDQVVLDNVGRAFFDYMSLYKAYNYTLNEHDRLVYIVYMTSRYSLTGGDANKFFMWVNTPGSYTIPAFSSHFTSTKYDY